MDTRPSRDIALTLAAASLVMATAASACTPEPRPQPPTVALPATATALPPVTPTATATATPRPTATPTATLTPAPTATPTPAQPGYHRQADGRWTLVTEEGEVLAVPAIPGLYQDLVRVWWGEFVLYLAAKENPYGLWEGTVAGYFKPDVYHMDAETQFRSGRATGGVAVRAEVALALLVQAGYPDRIVFPLPIDPTQLPGPVRVMESAAAGRSYLFLRVPVGARLVAPLPNQEGKTCVTISLRDYRGFALIGFNAGRGFASGHALDVLVPNLRRLIAAGTSVLRPGEALATGLEESLTESYIERLNADFRPPLPADTNVWLAIRRYSENVEVGNLAWGNILAVQGVPVLIVADDNPLLRP